MEINQNYLYVLFLVSLSVSCTSNCPMSDPAYDQSGYHECTKLYNALEAALVENQDNLLQLHEILFPSSSSQPTYAMVSFNVHELNESRSECYNMNERECYSTCWTSSLLLRSVDPFVLSILQLPLLNILLQTVGASELTGSCAHLGLELKVNFTVSDDEYKQMIKGIVQDLTSWLKVYASTQRSRSSWNAADLQYQGYYNSCDSDWTLVLVLFSTAVLIVALTTIALFKATPKIYQKVASNVERGNQWYSFFWAASFMASLCNFVLVSEEVPGVNYYLAFITPQSPLYSEQHVCGNETLPFLLCMSIIKMIITYLLIPLDILVAICIPKSEEFPIPYLAYILSFPLCCTCCCCRYCCCSSCRRSKQLRSKWIQTLALTSLLLFTHFIALSALSTILWAFVFPVQTLSVIAFFGAAIFCVTAFIAVLIRNIGQLTCRGRCRDNCNTLQPLLILMVTLFFAIVILTSYVYIKFITSRIDTSQVGGFIVSFLPSAILTILGWFVTKGKFIEQMFPQESDSTRNSSQHILPTERTPLTINQSNA